MPNLLTKLTKDAKARFLEELNYLNLAEIRGFCSDHGIPYKILAEYPDGGMKVTKDVDRKPIVLARVRHYLATGKAGQLTFIPKQIVGTTIHPRAGTSLIVCIIAGTRRSTSPSCGRSVAY